MQLLRSCADRQARCPRAYRRAGALVSSVRAGALRAIRGARQALAVLPDAIPQPVRRSARVRSIERSDLRARSPRGADWPASPTQATLLGAREARRLRRVRARRRTPSSMVERGGL